MKKFACNRLYVSYNRYVSQSVVSIDEEGKRTAAAVRLFYEYNFF